MGTIKASLLAIKDPRRNQIPLFDYRTSGLDLVLFRMRAALFFDKAAVAAVPLLAMIQVAGAFSPNHCTLWTSRAPLNVFLRQQNSLAASSRTRMSVYAYQSNVAPLSTRTRSRRSSLKMSVSVTAEDIAKVLDADLSKRIEKDQHAGLNQIQRWAGAFEELAQNEVFVQKCWAKEPFKLDGTMTMAVGCFGTNDLREHAHDYPYFYAGIGTLVDGGGWMMAKFDKTAKMDGRPDCMQAAEVDEQLQR